MSSSYTDLGVQRFILQNSEEELIDFIQEVLGPLIEYEQSRKGELVKHSDCLFRSKSKHKENG